MQLAAYLTTTLAMPAYAANPNNQNDSINPDAAELSSGDLGSFASQQAAGVAGNTIEQALKKFGTVETDIQLDDHFRLRGGSIDLLAPIFDKEQRMAFVQIGGRRIDDRNTINLGIGQRHFLSDWMLGYNGFFDLDPDRGHRRVGVGGEAWHDNLKLSANGYLRQSNWKTSHVVEDYDERPANGFDVRAEGYLPAYPALGGRLAYEQYFGDEVGLFGDNTRSKDPSATTVGVSYTPVPMLSFSYDHKRGSGQQDNTVGLQVNVQFDKPLSQQLDSSQVAARRSLAGSRYDLVERNNQIVMEYRKQELITLALPAEYAGLARKIVPLDYTVQSKHPVQKIEWQSDALTAAGGKVIDLGNHSYQLQYPAYNATGNNSYALSVVATDTQGNVSKVASTQVKVTGVDAGLGADGLSVDKTTIVAGTTDLATYTAEVTEEGGTPVPNIAVKWTTDGGTLSDDTSMTNDNGQATVTLSSTKAGPIQVSAQLEGEGIAAAPLVTVIADAASGQIDPGDGSGAGGGLSVDRNAVIANGTDKATFTAVVKDAYGNPIPGIAVNWTTDLGDIAASTTTDPDGRAIAELSSTTSGVAQVTAQVGSQSVVNAPQVTLGADTGSAGIGSGDLMVDVTTVIANGVEIATYAATVKDANGNAVPGITVNWTTTLGDLSAPVSSTGNNGQATIALSGTRIGQAQVTAQTGTQSAVDAPVVTLVADTASAGIGNGDLTVDKTTVVANNADMARYTAIVKDAHDNPVANMAVSWTTDLGTLSSTSETTNADGVATVTLRGTRAGDAQVAAVVNAKPAANADVVTLVADPTTASIDSNDLTVDKNSILADGVEAAVFSVIVKDANGNPVPGITVQWTTDNGTLSDASTVTGPDGSATVSLTEVLGESSPDGQARVNAAVASGVPVNAPLVALVVPEFTYEGPSVEFSQNSAPDIGASFTVTGRTGRASATTQVKLDIEYWNPDGLRIQLVTPADVRHTLKAPDEDQGSLRDKEYIVDLSGSDKAGTWSLELEDLGTDPRLGTVHSWNITL